MGEDKNRPKDVIAKFNIIGGEGISDYWRRNKSSIETRELANLLRALRKVAGYIGKYYLVRNEVFFGSD